jgi:hypothetical protein
MSEKDDIKKTECKITLGGREREIRFHYRAWLALETQYNGVENIVSAIKSAQFETIANLIFIGIKRDDGEVITKDNVMDWLDEYDLAGLLQIVKGVTTCLYASLPNAKKGAKAVEDPPAAE